MQFRWSPQSIAWFRDASNYTAFHKKLAQHIANRLSKEDTICDFGCGLGRLDLALSPYVSSITAVDIEPKVVDALAQDIETFGISNIHPLCRDSASVDQQFDVGIMSFFGKSGHDMLCYRKRCRKKLIRIVNAKSRSHLYPQSYRKTEKDTIPIVKNELTSKGIPFECIDVSIEFGQPFRSQTSAEDFILNHAPEASIQEVQDFLAEHATMTGREDFPIYLPNQKQLGIFVIE